MKISLPTIFIILNVTLIGIQSDQKENKAQQALQIIGHVVAEFYANKRLCMGVDNLWSQALLYNKSYLINFRQLCILLLSDDGENL
jgi:hypothetical protein